MQNIGLAEVLLKNVGADLRAIDEHDFMGEDGLMHCGTCREPIQQIVNIPLPGYGDRIVRMACACERAKMEQEEREEKIRKAKEEVSRLRGLSLMDAKVVDSTFDKFQTTTDNAYALKVCQRYATAFDTMMEKNQGLLFYGNPGTGKTFAAACIANSLLENMHSVIMTSFVKLIADPFAGEDEERTIQRINRCDLLIIDDLGAERSTDYALEKVYDIVDSRYRARKPMLLTTNLSLKEMQATNDIRYARIYDRIFEVCFPLEFKGKSWRYKEAASRYDSMKALLEV
jgi:DNA replication protein DnaC